MSIDVLDQDGNIGRIYQLSMAEATAFSAIDGCTSGVINGYIGTNAVTSVTIRATAYTAQGTDAQRSVKSTSASDTSAGTGARTIRLTYLNAAGQGPFTETITLNGTTAVATAASDIALVEKMEVLTVGSGGGNVGTIQLWTSNTGTGSAWATIAASDNRTYWAHHYVPSGKTCYITAIRGSSTVVRGSISLNVLNPVDTSIAQLNPSGTVRHDVWTNTITFLVPLAVVGPAIVFLNERPDANTASTVFGSFDFFEF